MNNQRNIIVIGGGAAGMIAAIAAAKAARSVSMRKMKNWAKRSLLQERAVAM